MKRTNWITWLGAMASIGALGAGQTGCTNVDCGTGTIDKDGKCIPSSNSFDNAMCGAGTHVGTTGKCEADQVVCDPTTTTAETDPVTKVTTCVGTGTTGCSAPISCPNATSGHQTICGQLLDLETSTPIAAAGATGTPCTAITADGPCALTITPYDAIAFAGNPTTATPLTNDEIVIDDCGRFRIKNVPATGHQFIGLGVDDNTMSPAMDLHRLTGIALPAKGGETDKNFFAYAITKATDAKWTAAAGLSTSMVDTGLYVGIFVHGTTPVAGVTVTRGGSPSPGDDYYFSDASPITRITLDKNQNVTGADGTALMINSGGGLITYSGQGMEPNGCMWNDNLLGAEIAKVAFVEPQQAVKSGDDTMLCP